MSCRFPLFRVSVGTRITEPGQLFDQLNEVENFATKLLFVSQVKIRKGKVIVVIGPETVLNVKVMTVSRGQDQELSVTRSNQPSLTAVVAGTGVVVDCAQGLAFVRGIPFCSDCGFHNFLLVQKPREGAGEAILLGGFWL
jgi:hypothetical protein